MYFFVRYTGYVMVFLGVFLMLAGLAGAVYGLFQHEALLQMVNASLEASQSAWRVTEMRFLTSLVGLSMFVAGMVVAALGQLMLVFADLANHTRETNILLRSLRSLLRRPASRPSNPSFYGPDQPAG
jgi:hypothetical protein